MRLPWPFPSRTDRLVRQIRRLRADLEQDSIRTNRKLDLIMTQNDEARELLTRLGASQDAQDAAITDVAADLTFLKDLLANQPVGEPLDEATMEEFRTRVTRSEAGASALAALAAQTDSTGGGVII